MTDMHLEVAIVPVSDPDQAKKFYQQLGWRFDDDASPADGVRFIQFTPPGSACSITFGSGIPAAAPAALQGTLVVSDVEAARDDLNGRGIDTSAIFHGAPFPKDGRLSGPHPGRASYASFVEFSDPDGNTWLVQEVTQRGPGRD